MNDTITHTHQIQENICVMDAQVHIHPSILFTFTYALSGIMVDRDATMMTLLKRKVTQFKF